MKKKCSLPADIHNCSFLDKQTLECKNPNDCSMQEKTEEEYVQTVPYQRKPRWYEKYYEK